MLTLFVVVAAAPFGSTKMGGREDGSKGPLNAACAAFGSGDATMIMWGGRDAFEIFGSDDFDYVLCNECMEKKRVKNHLSMIYLLSLVEITIVVMMRCLMINMHSFVVVKIKLRGRAEGYH
eukprot:517331_1